MQYEVGSVFSVSLDLDQSVLFEVHGMHLTSVFAPPPRAGEITPGKPRFWSNRAGLKLG